MARKGKKLSEEHKKALRKPKSLKGKENIRLALIGRKASEATKLKMSETRKGTKASEVTKLKQSEKKLIPLKWEIQQEIKSEAPYFLDTPCWICISLKSPTQARFNAYLLFEEINGPKSEDLIYRHKCDNPMCINPDHLEWGTTADNSRDSIERGRWRNQFGGLKTKR
jgi:hypothetical protein